MLKRLEQFGFLATITGTCLIGAFSLSAQAQGAGYAPPHVDTSGQNQQPPYPPAAVANGEQGTVVVGVAVTENGKAVRPSLDRSSGFNDLDNAALAAVLNWKYVPAMHDGVPVEERLEVGVNFQLPDMPSMSPPASTSSR
jgi:protein TonB